MTKKKRVLLTFIIIILSLILFAIFPRYIGDNNPVDGLVRYCYGYKFKVLKKSWVYEDKEYKTHGYYCVGIPYDYSEHANCFKPYFIGGYCRLGL